MNIISTHEGDLTSLRFRLDVDGERVPAAFWRPRETDGPQPLVLLQHPATSSKDDYFVADVARMWAARGWICGGIDAPFHGERETYDPMVIFRDRARMPAVAAQFAREISATLDYMLAELGADPARIGYVGYSMGSMLGVPAVARDGRFKVAAFCLVGEGGLVGPAAGPDSLLPLLEPVATRIVAKTGDELISRESTEALFAALPGERDLIWLPGGHFEIGPDVVAAALEWLKLRL